MKPLKAKKVKIQNINEQMKDFSEYVSKKLDTQESARAITETSTVTDTETVDDKVAE